MADADPAGRSLTPRLTRSLVWSIVDGVLHAAMVGTSESYFGAFAVELGHRDWALATLVTLPQLAGALSQPLAGALAARLGSRQRLVVLGAAAQAASILGFVAIAYWEVKAFLPLLAVKVAFWMGALVGVPAWSDWMCILTRDIPRARYFALRSSLAHTSLLLAFSLAGVGLWRAEALPDKLQTFALLFLIGAAGRALSAITLARMEDPSPALPRVGSRERLARALSSSSWRVAVYVAMLTFGTFVSAPFFTPYMLRELRLDYLAFAAVMATAILAKVATFPLIHRAASRFGLRPVLVVSGVGASAVPLMFAASDSPTELVIAQIASGAAWAGVELTSFQLLLASAEDEVRTEFISLSSCLTGTLQLVGGMVGGGLVEMGGLSYREVFVLSTGLRLIPVLLLFTAVTDMARPLPKIFMRIVSVRPGGGVMRRPILADALDEDTRPAKTGS